MGSALYRIDDTAPAPPGPCALVVGNFDGVHAGHAVVLDEAVSEARRASLPARVLTFDPHPAAVVGRGAPPILTTLERRTELLAALGVERVCVRRFDASFAAWSPDRFVRDLVVGALGARLVVVGQNFRFGAKRAGDLEVLRTLGAELGFDVRIHAIARDAQGPYSSTRAREALARGDLDEARRVLGRPHELSGVVVTGDRRGRTIGFPTANLDGVPELLPPDGVYAVQVDRLADGGAIVLGGGVTNIGVRPTVGGGARTVETYLFGEPGDLYGATLRVHLVARLRAEMRFGGLQELKDQIARDCAAAKAAL